MRFKIKDVNDPKIGERKEFLRFAVLPEKVENKIVWLENYIILCRFSVVRNGMAKANTNEWIIIEKKLNNK